MSVKRVAAGIAAAAAISGSLFGGATIAAGSAGADPWKCDYGKNCWGDWGRGHGGDWGRGADWGHGDGWGDGGGWGYGGGWGNGSGWGCITGPFGYVTWCP